MKFEIYQDKRKEWRWRGRARNGQIVAISSEGYTRRASCVQGLKSLIRGVGGNSAEVENPSGEKEKISV